MAVKYFTDKEKRTCVCIISVKVKRANKSFTYSFKGKAKCCPTDNFDEATGLELAHLRALLKFKAWEKQRHETNMKFCAEAIEYYKKMDAKLNERYQKTISTLDRINSEYEELIDEL